MKWFSGAAQTHNGAPGGHSGTQRKEKSAKRSWEKSICNSDLPRGGKEIQDELQTCRNARQDGARHSPDTSHPLHSGSRYQFGGFFVGFFCLGGTLNGSR